MTPSEDSPYRLPIHDLESSAHLTREDLVEVADTELESARELPATVEPSMRAPLQPRRLTLPDGHGEIDRQLTRVLVGVVLLFAVVIAYFVIAG